MIFFAHSADDQPESEWQTLKNHLIAVGDLGHQKASCFGGHDLARIAGLLHDLGKYTHAFQQRLRGAATRVDHSTHGALVALERFDHDPVFGYLLAYCIAGHHAGLSDRRETQQKQRITPLETRLANTILPKLETCWQDEITLPVPSPLSFCRGKVDEVPFQFSVLGRMLYSCLVDSDFLDTEKFYRQLAGSPQRDDRYPTLSVLKSALDHTLSQPRFQSPAGINAIRKRILDTVRQRSELSPGLFSLNVPTGGGKTLSSLAFAVEHALRHKQRRIILVIPFTSIVEQNAAVWRDALGKHGASAVLEHHSAFNPAGLNNATPNSQDKLRQAAENWEAPIIVTTAVQFFESLFANRSSRCRKLHNIANSVVIIDEAQTLPISLLSPCVAMIKELARNYRTSLVLCTATQPALNSKDGFPNGFDDVRELAPEPKKLYQNLKRVTVTHIGQLADDELVAEIMQHHQVLCIVNNRRHARALFDQLRGEQGSFHLTTLMCAQHRSEQLALIRQQLRDGKTVRLVSTSLIEAGVDVDFPSVYRAEAGLDSIAQAAGRCNREGRNAAESSMVKVFQTDLKWSIPAEIAQYADAFRATYRLHTQDPMSLAAIRDYFKQVYWVNEKQLDARGIMDCAWLENKTVPCIDYEQIAQRFRLIDSTMKAIIIPYMSETIQTGETVASLIQALTYADQVGGIARKLQRFLVQVPEQGLKALIQYGAVTPVQPERFGQQFLVLQNEDLYDNECGLSWDEPAFLKAENLVF